MLYVNMKELMNVRMIYGSKLLSSFSMSGIYSFLKFLHYRQAHTSSGNVEKIYT